MENNGQYQLVVANDVKELNQTVTNLLAKGWQLHKSPILQPDPGQTGGMIFAQALTRPSLAMT